MLDSVKAIQAQQLMPATAKSLGVSDPYNPVQNVEGGVKYLKSMLNKYNQQQLSGVNLFTGKSYSPSYPSIENSPELGHSLDLLG